MTLTLRTRIDLTLVPLLALLLVLGSGGVVLLSRLGGLIDAILRENYDSVIAMERLRETLERIDSSFQFTLSGEETKARAQYRANWEAYREALRTEQGNVTLPGEKELVEELTALTERYRQQGDAFYARASHDPRLPQEYYGSPGLLETFSRIKSVTGQIAQINQDNMEQASQAAKREARVSLVGFGIGLALAVILAGIGGWLTFHSILGPVRAVTRSARGVSEGDLDQVVPYLSRDALGELADAFNQMTRRLREDQQSAKEQTRQLLTTAETLRGELGERARMEQSLRQLASIVESSDDAIFSRGPDGTIASWNKGAEQVFGYPAEAVLGQSQFILVPPEYEGELTAILERVHRGEHVEHFETVRRRKDGQRIWVSLTCFPVHDETGAIVSVGSIVRDITDRKRAEEETRRASAYNRSLIEASLDPLVTIGPDGKITDVNAATEQATGYTRSDLLGRDFADSFTEPERARDGYRRVFSEGSVRDYPLEIRHRNGRLISVLYNAAVYRDEHGKVVGVFAAARDVTERMRAEETVRRLALLQGVVASLGQRALRMMDSSGKLLEEAVALAARTLDVALCNIAELQPGGEELLLRAGVGWKEGLVGRAIVKSKDSQAGWTIRSDQPMIVEDTAAETRFIPLPRLLGDTTASSMSVVISTPEGPYGTLGVHTRRRRTFTQDEARFLQGVANVLGAAIHRQRSEERLHRSNRALSALSSCNQALIRATDEATLLQRVCEIVVEQAGYRLGDAEPGGGVVRREPPVAMCPVPRRPGAGGAGGGHPPRGVRLLRIGGSGG
jgi:PAS domain S-box-containing protein